MLAKHQADREAKAARRHEAAEAEARKMRAERDAREAEKRYKAAEVARIEEERRTREAQKAAARAKAERERFELYLHRRLRFSDLRERGIVKNWATLRNRIRDNGFPTGKLTGPNERTWGEQEVQEWINNCPTAAKRVPRSPGRPRSHPPGTS